MQKNANPAILPTEGAKSGWNGPKWGDFLIFGLK